MTSQHIPLSQKQCQQTEARLATFCLASSIQGIFWFPVPNEYLSPTQKEHLPQCGPYFLAIEVLPNGLSLEFLLRGHGTLHCDCIAMAPKELQQHAIHKLEKVALEQSCIENA